MSKILIIFAILLAALIFFMISPPKKSDDTVCFEGSCINTELATTPEERKIGLMNRESLPENMGMLFIFDKEGIYKFWMKNTLIPLDIIWLDENGKIIYIEKNARPCNVPTCPLFGPESSSKYTLEVNGGYTERHKINVGDKARINIK
ncbi:MAG: DUF192 domain-containing protein [Candidatus Methanoperedens sp.]|nr:DUF192 domain-containing protein [Candidatus Methanoperedens sp.]